MSPSKSNAGGRHAKAEASFAHSKRCREVRLLLQTVRLRHGPRCHDARSVWSARSLLPLCEKPVKLSDEPYVRRSSNPPKREMLRPRSPFEELVSLRAAIPMEFLSKCGALSALDNIP